jgi:hypothetical protein
MRSLTLQSALTEFAESAAGLLQAEVAAGAEVPFELDSRSTHRGMASTPLYCYRPLTGRFISERRAELERLPSRGEAARLLKSFDGLERYLAISGAAPARPTKPARVDAALIVLLQDVFEEQSEFELRPERLQAALERLEQSALASAGELTLVATLHGLTISSAELQLTDGLTLAQPRALGGLPEEAISSGAAGSSEHVVVVLSADHDRDGEASRRATGDAVPHGREVLEDLLRALRLFGDGRVMLGELAWALRRFELGCERQGPFEALTDHLLGLRALLEPEGPASGLLAGRLAALCATPEQRLALTERIVQALTLERAVIAGDAAGRKGALALAREMGDHLRALLRDVICGHLTPDLVGLADELLLEDGGASAEERSADPGEPEEILDLLI